jgi:hypothetical protein
MPAVLVLLPAKQTCRDLRRASRGSALCARNAEGRKLAVVSISLLPVA